MIFSEKLFLIRKNKGYSQEELAESLDVSRQAIAKWESGQSYPEIYNLIALSRLFNVTVDYLVKDNDSCMIKPIEQTTCADDDLRKFILKAKKETYAGKRPEISSSRPLSHDLKYEEDDMLYIDTYLGGECFSGEEAVWKDNVPVWSMNYSGRVIEENFSGDFLKAALREVPFDKPYRGPAFYQDGDYVYVCKVDGAFDWYQGYEEILYHDVRIYECYFHGGKIR
ncbi:MAG: helix-turn-helix domain-containing protein [Clostridiales bacterium]|jgi:transcriptional regulator with XRE-family HTH domain|nr:helix-turn-helix domain-containing protein [Clostridiales bacterium]